MAKVKVVGQAIVITSELKLDDIKTVAKYRPQALTLYEGEGDEKEPVFCLGVGEDSINKFGASFNKETRDESKKAIMTIVHEYQGEDIKGFVADNLGAALMNLKKLEEIIPGVLQEIAAQKAAILADVEIAQ